MQTTIETTQAKVSSIRRDFLFVFNVDKKIKLYFILYQVSRLWWRCIPSVGVWGRWRICVKWGENYFPFRSYDMLRGRRIVKLVKAMFHENETKLKIYVILYYENSNNIDKENIQETLRVVTVAKICPNVASSWKFQSFQIDKSC